MAISERARQTHAELFPGHVSTLQVTGLTDVLPGLVLLGIGVGVTFPAAINNATLGVDPRDAGVASATYTTSQQIGASIGTALLSTVAASTTAGFISSHPVVGAAAAAVHGYTTAFGWSAIGFAAGALLTGLLFAWARGRQPSRKAMATIPPVPVRLAPDHDAAA